MSSVCSPYIDIDSILMTRKIDTERHPQQNTVNLRLLYLGDKVEHFGKIFILIKELGQIQIHNFQCLRMVCIL